MDEQEMDRIDLARAKYFMLLDKKRFLESSKSSGFGDWH